MADPIQSYLARFAEPEAHEPWVLSRTFEHCLVVPAYDEAPDPIARMASQGKGGLLVVVVVNVPDNADTASVNRTQVLLAELHKLSADNVLIINRVANPIPQRQGVGLARKIGTDVALKLFTEAKLASPWLRQTDADADLPADYYSAALPAGGALVYSHTHHAKDPLLQQAANLYDLHMRYYVAAIRHAGSHYAYPTLGSTIAVHARDYAAVRGFPKRNAAEDFYLLNKVAKVGGVTISDVSIALAARTSHRVPFGTGPALAKVCSLLEQDPTGKSYLSYSWSSFRLLASAHAELNQFANGQPPLFSRNVEPLMDALGFSKKVHMFTEQYAPGPRRQTALRDWFDAFKTLRFVHEARRYHADEPLIATMQRIPTSVRDDARMAHSM